MTKFDASLRLGNLSQEVEVTAAAPLLETDKADVARTFSAKQISELPSIGRNLQAFELLNPGMALLGRIQLSDKVTLCPSIGSREWQFPETPR